MSGNLRPILAVFVSVLFLTGGIYPTLVWALGQTLFPIQANGSRIFKNGQVSGSSLLGQHFSKDTYFWPRPAFQKDNNATYLVSLASNLNPQNPNLIKNYKARQSMLLAAHMNTNTSIPADFMMTSASGIDPHISKESALYQSSRIAAARRVQHNEIIMLIERMTEDKSFGFLGEQRVNVLELNLAIDLMKGRAP